MPRRSRRGSAGLVWHVMNRAVKRLPLFESPTDYDAFVRVLREAQERVPLRLLSYVVMPNHWHLVVWPVEDHELSRFMAWLTGTHARRWNLYRGTVGLGAVYQARYKAIPVSCDHHFLVACKYVERNPVKARLAAKAAEWRWSSASESDEIARPAIHEWPVARPDAWREFVDSPESAAHFERLRSAIRGSRPFGQQAWCEEIAGALQWTIGRRPRGRPPRE